MCSDKGTEGSGSDCRQAPLTATGFDVYSTLADWIEIMSRDHVGRFELDISSAVV